MSLINSVFRFAKYKDKLPYVGVVKLQIEITRENALEIVENYSGEGWIGQGCIESISEKGYKSWKIGIRRGIEYAYYKLKNSDHLKVTIQEAEGMTTDTNPTILAFVASRAILNKLDHFESKEEFQLLENLMYTSWDYELDALPDFHSFYN